MREKREGGEKRRCGLERKNVMSDVKDGCGKCNSVTVRTSLFIHIHLFVHFTNELLHFL